MESIKHQIPTDGKCPADTAVINNTYRVFPNDLNSNNTMFGGKVLSELDRICLIVAERHSESTCVTASMDSIHFLKPAHKGDNLVFNSHITCAWSTSMEIYSTVHAEDPKTCQRELILTAYSTFVAVDKNNKPTTIPALVPTNKQEETMYQQAQIRRQKRKNEAQKLRAASFGLKDRGSADLAHHDLLLSNSHLRQSVAKSPESIKRTFIKEQALSFANSRTARL